jgi:hypothetical protein
VATIVIDNREQRVSCNLFDASHRRHFDAAGDPGVARAARAVAT